MLITPPAALAQPSQFLALHVAKPINARTNPLDVPDKNDSPIDFCGEMVPVHDPAIVDRWTQTINHQAALAGELALMKRRASVVFPLIEPILRQYNIPADFKFLPLLESAVTNRAVSPKGAAGFWQLMPGTAQALGLTVSRRQDDRFNLLKATHAACRYINELYDELGSWMLVATAYNAGPNYIHQLVRQYPDRHPMALPYRAAATKAYLFQTVAIKELFTRPQVYRDLLSSQNFAALSDEASAVQTAERATILASFGLNEGELAKRVAESSTASERLAPADSIALAMVREEGAAETDSTTTPEPAQPIAPVVETVSPVIRLITRSLSEGPLSEGKFCVFQVVQPVLLNGRSFAVGDMIQAHIDIIDAGSGRVFLRTDRLTTAQTQETFTLKLVATEQPKQPGVALPTRLENWQLSWEAL